MNRTTVFIIAILGTLGSGSIVAQKLSVETLIDTNSIRLGDQIGLNYIIEKERNLTTRLPVFADTITKGIEIIGDATYDSLVTKENLLRIKIGLTITSFDTGIYYIPPQPIILNENGYSDTLFSRATYLMVLGVPLDTTYTVRDIKGVERIPVTIGELLLYTGILLILAALVALLIIYLKRKKQEKPFFKPLKPEEPAHITALRELDKLKAQKLWQQRQIKEYYTRITYIIRWYIGKRFLVPALELTSDEILDHIRQASLDNIDYSNLESLLNLADLVKFAKGDANPEENILHLDNAYDFIKKTKEMNPASETNSN